MTSPRPDATRGSQDPLDATFLCFAVAWTIAALFHALKRADIVATPLSAAFTLSALVFLVNPRSVHRFALVALGHALLFLSHTPDAGNHEFFAFACEVMFLVVYAVLLARDRRALSGCRWTGLVAPSLRWATLVLYLFAVLHKLNTDFLSPASCGAALPTEYLTDHVLTRHLHLDRVLPIASTGAAWFFIGSSLALEVAIPVLLVIRRTAFWGFFAGWAFHFFLGVFYFWHFTPMLYSLFLLFLPHGFHRWVVQQWLRARGRALWGVSSPTVGQATRLVLFAAIGLLPVLYVVAHEVEWLRLQLGSYNRGREAIGFAPVISILFGWLPFVAGSLGLAWIVLHFVRRHSSHSVGSAEPRLRMRPLVAWLPVFLVLNGLTPYLGIKTHQSFSMFSNLWTEGGETNHLFMPLLELTGWTRDLAWPIQRPEEQGPDGRRAIVDGAYVYADLRDKMYQRIQAGETEIELSYLRDGEVVDLDRAELHPDFATPRPWLMRKLFSFRRVALPENRSVCAY